MSPVQFKRSIIGVEDSNLDQKILKRPKIELDDCPIKSLPLDLITEIAAYSDLQGAARLSPACRHLCQATADVDRGAWKVFASRLGLTPTDNPHKQVGAFVGKIRKIAHLAGLDIEAVPTLDGIKNLEADLKNLSIFIAWDAFGFEIDELHPSFDDFPTLEKRTANASLFGNWCETHKRKLAQIRSLNFNDNKQDHHFLTFLPPEIGYLTGLEELDISNNQLTSLPPEIDLLTRLKKFDVSNNPLASS